MTAAEIQEGMCKCGHIDSRHDQWKLNPERRAEAEAADLYPCVDCACFDWREPRPTVGISEMYDDAIARAEGR